ncbi:unnamed protein product [Adineta ricciae]|uniref:F-box domain-containing protein n=1 Tax=Adineta ricciae TaxID=249248 RepID=A0A815V9C7_ADIRI|nr:unnamed protein product [Adineta ricciae]CAF1527127.1 unnamed protein product [Adineta ricciae]
MGRRSKSKKICSIENLSNEIFYEIFKYVDGCDVFYSFSNLNHRFENLLKSLFFILNINSDHLKSKKYLRKIFKQIFNCHQNQIISIYMDMSLSFKDTFSFDSSFNQLATLHLYNLESKKFLRNLSCLSNLSLLNLHICDPSIDLNVIYEIVLTLPKLKTFHIKTDHNLKFSSLSHIKKNLNEIERLNIRDHCDFNEILSILSCSSSLSHLVYIQTNPIDYNIQINSPIILSKLTHVYLRITGMKFHVLENFLKQISLKLQTLSLTTENEDMKYLDGNHWENYLSKNLPQLEKFYFKSYMKHHHRIDQRKLNQFLTSFWIKRQWILEINVHCTHFLYSITPYKKRWYDSLVNDGITPSSFQLEKSCQLTLNNVNTKFWKQIQHLISLTKIYHLVLLEGKTFIGKLIQIVNSLPELISLQFNSLSFVVPNGEDLRPCFSKKSPSKIEKIYVENIETNAEIALLSTLCPRMNCLRIISFGKNTNSYSFYY